MGDSPETLDYLRVEKAIRFIDEHVRSQPTLNEIADHLGMSPFHVQRLFSQWAGVSPKRFLQYLTLEQAKRLLRDSQTVLDAAYESGLSGSARLHDLFATLDGVTPGEYRRQGAGVAIRWGVHDTPFGSAFFAATERGLTALTFLPEATVSFALARLRKDWPGAEIVESPEVTADVARRVFRRSGGHVPVDGTGADVSPLRLHVRGTNFQIRVWEALLRVPAGAAVTYGDLARAVGKPDASRAIGGALARNPVAYVIPCHRVLRSTGGFGEYRWGAVRKKAILGWEAAGLENEEDVA